MYLYGMCMVWRTENGDHHQERGVHALFPILLPLPQRRHLGNVCGA